jgi:putative flippase GtrA
VVAKREIDGQGAERARGARREGDVAAAEPDREDVGHLVGNAGLDRKSHVPLTTKDARLIVQSEARTALFAWLASVVATLHDGLAYQVTLSMAAKSYGSAALVGALAGGITNFLVNRYWTFRATARPFLGQSVLFAVGSLLTFAVLRTSLWILVEKAGVRERMAWFPAKAIAWVAMSYPFQRFVVFPRTARQ